MKATHHIGSIASTMPEAGGIEVDVGALVARLILFDRCSLESVRLKELPALIAVFGVSGLLELIDSQALQIVCDAMSIGEIGQVATLEPTVRRGGPLPLGSFRLAGVSAADRRDYLHRVFTEVDQAPINFKELKRLKKILAAKLLEYPRSAGEAALLETSTDLRQRHPILVDAIQQAIRTKLGVEAGPLRIDVTELANEGDFEVSVPLNHLRVDPQEQHELVKDGLLRVAGLNQRIQLMNELQAISGFREPEADLFRARIGVLAQRLDPSSSEVQFGRVISLAGLPDLRQLSSGISAERLLRLRESDEVIEFRSWLADLQSQTDTEVQEALAGVRSRVAGMVRGPSGKAIRFLVSTGVGFIPGSGLVAGPIASAIDTFLVDRIMGRPGPATFLGREYKSIFNPNRPDGTA